MQIASPKIKPLQGIALLFLLLVIPIGIYIFQSEAIGDIRSQAAQNYITPDYCNSAKIRTALKCKDDEIGIVSVGTAVRQESAGFSDPKKTTVKACKCSPKDGSSGKTVSVGTPTPTTSIQLQCNKACTSDAACGTGMVCVQENGAGKCRNAQCFGIADCWCYKATTPTPAPSCNSTCTTDTDCGMAFVCVETQGGLKCRNPQCFGKDNCVCYSTLTTPTPEGGVGGGGLGYNPTASPIPYDEPYTPPTRVVTQPQVIYVPATPTPDASILLADLMNATPTPNPLFLQPKLAAPILTINPFYDAKKQTNPQIVLSGTSDPNAELNISLFPDGIITTTQADAMGNWQYMIPKQLSGGDKQLTIIARTQTGGQMTKTEAFTVVGGFQFPIAAIVFTALLVLGVGGYMIFINRKKKNEPPPFDPMMPHGSQEGYQQPYPNQQYSNTHQSSAGTMPGKDQQASPYGFEKPTYKQQYS